VTVHFSDRLIESIRRAGAPTCVGLDPVLERLPADVRDASGDPAQAIGVFCRGVIDAVAEHAAAVKFQSACFERYGGPGFGLLWELAPYAAERGLSVILDAKRGDIGISAEHYAAMAVGAGAHAITVNAYLGPKTVEPYLQAALGVFVLVRTSNPDSDLVQGVHLSDDRTVAGLMADQVRSLGETCVGGEGYSDVGAVVGATKPEDGKALRSRMPRQVFLVPGYGAQGGTAADVRALLDERPEAGGGVLVTASRSVIYPPEVGNRSWAKGVEAASISFSTEIRQVLGV
jgi:orotidine-5'-phosphate decarboxylase